MTTVSRNATTIPVTKELFGGNAIWNANTDSDDGTVYEHFAYAADMLGVTSFRIPGGQTENFFAGGLIVAGDIPSELRKTLEMIEDRFDGVTASIVLPTDRSFTTKADVALLAEIVARDFPGLVTAYEIGNEYWGEDFGIGSLNREEFYGRRASSIAEALEEGLGRANADAEILIQTANPNGHGSAYNWKAKDGPGAGMGAEQRWAEANGTIADQLSPEARDAIDGIIHHFYWTRMEDDPADSGEHRMHWHSQVWEQALGKPLELHITEWNVAAANYELHGLKAGGALLDMFVDMLEAGVDAAQVWPLQHNTRNDLAGGNRRDVQMDQSTGLVVSSVAGTVFDLLATNTVGLRYVDKSVAGFSSEPISANSFVAQFFEDTDTRVSYVTANFPFQKRFEIAEEMVFDGAGATVTIVGIDRASTDGQRSNDGGAADAIQIDGRTYYVNEDDAASSIRTVTFTAAEIEAGATVLLRPYEVAQVLSEEAIRTGPVKLPATAAEAPVPAPAPKAGPGSEPVPAPAPEPVPAPAPAPAPDLRVNGGQSDDILRGGAGADRINGGRGNDRIDAGRGDDVLIGGKQGDVLKGGAGADQFVFRSNDFTNAVDRIEDFEIGRDLIVFEDMTRSDLRNIRSDYDADREVLEIRLQDRDGDMQTFQFDGHSSFRAIADLDNILFLG
ncbi:calcium-binding protein [Jannaschia formosa]|uniref:calcium-binding protein n=1 Tax=Jannaschia formosa TaxID=2259592 RepID=UPI000E1B7B62|nr:hypothetical protein [Jannaschia formosa]TFL19807.1 hypothetical protein DR046_00195 [Jannaschia formosa]